MGRSQGSYLRWGLFREDQNKPPRILVRACVSLTGAQSSEPTGGPGASANKMESVWSACLQTPSAGEDTCLVKRGLLLPSSNERKLLAVLLPSL